MTLKTGSTVSFSRVFDGVRGYNCTSDVSSNLTCVETNCTQTLAVRCPIYQEVTAAPSSTDSGSLAGVIAVLVIMLLAVTAGWIMHCVVIGWKKKKSR